MLKRILVALDTTHPTPAPQATAFWLAHRMQAEVDALVLVDASPLSSGEAVPAGGLGFRQARDRQREAHWHEEADADLLAIRCSARNEGLTLTGDCLFSQNPAQDLSRRALGHDLVVVAQNATLGGDDMRWIESYLDNAPRPLLVVPPAMPLVSEGTILLAYDGSANSARAMQQLVHLGLGAGQVLRVVSISHTQAEADRLAQEGAAYLAAHGLNVRPLGLVVGQKQPAELINTLAVSLDASLLVLGAFGHRSWKTRLFGSTTRILIRQSTVPVMLCH